MFNVKDGLGPLCRFLEKEVPAELFPNVKESNELNRATTMMKIVSYT